MPEKASSVIDECEEPHFPVRQEERGCVGHRLAGRAEGALRKCNAEGPDLAFDRSGVPGKLCSVPDRRYARENQGSCCGGEDDARSARS